MRNMRCERVACPPAAGIGLSSAETEWEEMSLDLVLVAFVVFVAIMVLTEFFCREKVCLL
jgi:hypothetical protein